MEEIIKYKSDYFKDIEKHQKAGQKNCLKKIKINFAKKLALCMQCYLT